MRFELLVADLMRELETNRKPEYQSTDIDSVIKLNG